MNNNYEGWIEVIFGCMFSGKSTELLRLIRREEVAKKNTIMIKYAKDTRYCDAEICTHDKVTRISYPSELLYETYNANKEEFDKSDQIGIDEGQFFPDLVEFAEDMANKGKKVFIAMLDGNFERSNFDKNQIQKMIAIADGHQKLFAVCKICKKNQGSFSKRTVDSKETELIGGAEMYVPVCRKCYFTGINK